MSLQALLYDTNVCDAVPVALVEGTTRALEASGNGHLLFVPAAMLPQCSALYVNSERSPFQITLTAQPQSTNQIPYLQLSAYMQDECGEDADAQLNLLADESVHPLGQFAPQTITNLRQTFNPDMMQTQQYQEDQSPVTLYYKATTNGVITIYNSADGSDESELMKIPLQQFMDTCFSQEFPFPGFQGEGLAGRGDGRAMAALQGLLSSLDSTTSQPLEKLQSKLTKDVSSADDVVLPDVDHVATLVSGFSSHIRSRAAQGLPISFQITSSTGPQNAVPLQLADQQPSNDRLHHGFKNGHNRPKHHAKHGMDKYLGPCEQSAALMVLAFVGLLIMIKMAMMRRRARQALLQTAQMQERPIEKRNKDYIAVPTQSV